MRTAHASGSPVPDRHDSPSVRHAQALARELLGPVGTRLAHVRTAGFVASRLAVLFGPEDAELLVVAATLHDIGYSPRIAHTGFHPLDGGAFLRSEGFPEGLVTLVANHSLALMTADGSSRRVLREEFPSAGGLLTDALSYADMHSAPDGRVIPVQHRLADIARRHSGPEEVARAAQLRAAMARVGAALLAAQSEGRPAAHEAARPAVRLAARPAVVLAGGGAWLDLRQRAPDCLAVEFAAWWSAELVYSREVERFDFEGSVTVGVRDTALRLAHLRARADLRRDRYFRRALA